MTLFISRKSRLLFPLPYSRPMILVDLFYDTLNFFHFDNKQLLEHMLWLLNISNSETNIGRSQYL